MVNVDISAIETAVKRRQLHSALQMCNGALEQVGLGSEYRQLIRLRAEIFARLREPGKGAEDLVTLINQQLAEKEDYFSAALYYLRDDRYREALSVTEAGSQIDEGDSWYDDEFVFLNAYCLLKLGEFDRARALTEALPDDIQMIIKLTEPPLTKADLRRKK